MESILTSIKKLLGIAKEYTHFDDDIIIHINTVLNDLHQMGVGPDDGFVIEDDTAIWSDFIEDNMFIESVKTYVFLRVKLIFDISSLGSATIDAYERQIEKFEWRLNVAAETP